MKYMRKLKFLALFIVFHETMLAQDQYYRAMPMGNRLAAAPGAHVVQAGETVSSIARKYRVSPATLIEQNRIANPNALHVGQRLAIPGAVVSKRVQENPPVRGQAGAPPVQGNGAVHVVRAGETLSRIARSRGIAVSDLMAWNGIADPSRLQAGQRLRLGAPGATVPVETPAAAGPLQVAAGAQAHTHTVQPGETLSAISRRHGIPVASLMQWNGITDPARLGVGTQLMLGISRSPAGTTPPVAASPAPAEPASRPPATPVDAYKSLVSGRPAHAFRQHTVRPGDTLHSISRENHVSVEALRQANGLGESNFIRDGQQLQIPGRHQGATPEQMVRESAAVPSLELPAPPAPQPEPKVAVPRALPSEPEGTRPLIGVPGAAPQESAELQQSNRFGFAPTPSPEQDSEYLAYTVGPGETQPLTPGEPARAEEIETIAALFSTTPEQIRLLNRLAPDEPLQIGARILVPAAGLFGN